MRRKLSFACLLLAWLCANGVVWNAVQVVLPGQPVFDGGAQMCWHLFVPLTLMHEKPA